MVWVPFHPITNVISEFAGQYQRLHGLRIIWVLTGPTTGMNVPAFASAFTVIRVKIPVALVLAIAYQLNKYQPAIARFS